MIARRSKVSGGRLIAFEVFRLEEGKGLMTSFPMQEQERPASSGPSRREWNVRVVHHLDGQGKRQTPLRSDQRRPRAAALSMIGVLTLLVVRAWRYRFAGEAA
jgi:hypothetical protein